ncbi:hypothetical protein GS597_16100 [Synechococcales cyanobacterium C]|uniref:Uncharacterized protein n=1 Tax=Petrachloros mirabilis ULC683 TaxID=2781853 RepID=A0A8K2A8G5_9CYAN|nr:hypothetical protein [Petrachloros mirabilis ULC683]
MTPKISNSWDSSPSREPGVTDSLWQPPWWRWLISALSGTVETEKQIAWLRKETEELRKSNEEMRKETAELRKSNEEFEKSNEEFEKSNEDARIQDDQQLAELLRQNERLAELELKLDAVLPKSGSS